MAESLVDLVLRASEEQQAQLLAATITYVGQAFLEKTGAIAGDGNTMQGRGRSNESRRVLAWGGGAQLLLREEPVD
jgi:hypothetical protein